MRARLTSAKSVVLPAVFLIGACASAAQTPAQTSAVSKLEGSSWKLVRIEGADKKPIAPDDKAKYTIAFNAGGALTARIDCNRGRGTWKSSSAGELQLGPLALTRAMCPPGSLHDRIVKDWESVRSYAFKDGRLFLSLSGGGGSFELEPSDGK